MELENGNMEIDIPNGSNGDLSVTNGHGLVLWTVPINASGEGLPYAPIDWPDHGDNWSWKVGNRVTVSGYFLDRYLYPPLRFQKSTRRKKGYASKLSVAQYIRSGFPGKDVDAFFSSFSWKIPSEKLASMKGNKEGPFPLSVHSEERPECSPSTSDTIICEAKNKMCDSLVAEGNNIVSMAMPCDLCCSEPGFCRYCCCILCCKTVSSSFGGYSYIKCASSGDKGYICGHIAHVDCALRSYMAGTVGGSIGLDAEYHCRRCDARTELVSHVRKIKRACSYIGSRDEIEKILDVGICVLRGSKKETARKLLNCIESAKSKLKHGAYLEDIWKVEENSSGIFPGLSRCIKDSHELLDDDHPQEIASISFDHRIDSLKLDDEIQQVLQLLRKSLESEYRTAEERLYAQKDCIVNLYEQLEQKSDLLSRPSPGDDLEALLLQYDVLEIKDQLRREVKKLKDMEKIGKGFGRTSKRVLKEYFSVEVED